MLNQSGDIASQRNKHQRTVELDFKRRCLQINRKEEIWNRLQVECSITEKLEIRALHWYGNIQRMPKQRWSERKIVSR